MTENEMNIDTIEFLEIEDLEDRVELGGGCATSSSCSCSSTSCVFLV